MLRTPSASPGLEVAREAREASEARHVQDGDTHV